MGSTSSLRALLAQVTASLDEYETSNSPRSHEALISSISHLQSGAMSPEAFTTRLKYSGLQHGALAVALETNVLQTLSSAGGETMTCAAIAEKTETQELLVVRILRLLGVIHVIDEVGPSTYAANANTTYICHPGQIGSIKFLTGLTNANIANTRAFMRANGGQFNMFSDDGKKGAWEYCHGTPVFQYFQTHPEDFKDFSAYMTVQTEGSEKWFEMYPAAENLAADFGNDQERVMMVDVGGGVGHNVVAFKKASPKLPGRFVLQDLEETVEASEAHIDGVEKMAIDFFAEQPVKGARAYFLSHILHDWSDKQSLTILSHVRSSMARDSLLLINEYVIPDTGAPFRHATFDVLMMYNCAGIERTLSQWTNLLDEAGFKVMKVWPGSQESVIEAQLKA